MPEALQVRLKVWVYSTLLLPLMLTEEGGAKGAIRIIMNISIVPITSILYTVYINNESLLS